MRMLSAIVLLASIATAAIAQPAQPAPIEYTLTVTPDELTVLARGLDELPAKIANPIAAKLAVQVMVQNKAREEAQKPKAGKAEKPKE